MMNTKLIRQSFRSLMITMIFAGVVAMCGSFIDGVVIGNCLGVEDMASFGYAAPVFMLIAAAAGIFANGGKALCSSYLGEGRYEEARKNYSMSIIASVIFGVVITMVCNLAAEPIAQVMGASGDYVAEAADYIRGIGLGAIPIMLMQVVTSYLSLDDAEKLAFWGAVVMTAVNVTLDLLVGLVWHGGLFEMALATSISYLAALLVQMLYFGRRDRLFCMVKPEFSIKKIGQLVNTGLPSGVSRVSFSAASVLLNIMLSASAGEMAVSAISVQSTLNNFISAIFMGITSTISVFSGMYYGERNRTALKYSFKIACGYGLILAGAITVLLLIFAPQFSSLILKADDATMDMAAGCLRFFALSLPMNILALILMYHYLSTKKLALSHTICVLNNFVLVVFPAFLLEMMMGVNGIWLGWLASGVLLVPAVTPLLGKYRGGTLLEKWMAVEPGFAAKDQEVFETSISDNLDDVMQTVEQVKIFCMEAGMAVNQMRRICLAIEEMAKNIVQHAFRGKNSHFIDVRLVLSEQGSCLSIRDNGMKFDPLAYQNQEEHYGIRLIRGIAKGMDYRYTVGMNNLSVYM